VGFPCLTAGIASGWLGIFYDFGMVKSFAFDTSVLSFPVTFFKTSSSVSGLVTLYGVALRRALFLLLFKTSSK
jgi:hypothetical protein